MLQKWNSVHAPVARSASWARRGIPVVWFGLSLGVALATATAAGATTIGWTTEVVASSGTPPSGSPSDALGAPSGSFVSFGSNTATYGSFTEIVSYDTAALASALGVSTAVLASSDLIVFDQNQSAGFGFEGTAITVDDGTTSFVINHAAGDPPSGPIVANDDMTAATFNSLFGTSTVNHQGFLIFDLDVVGVNAFDPGFTVEITGGGAAAGSSQPDVLGLGVLNAVPEPSPSNLLLFGLVGIAVGRRLH